MINKFLLGIFLGFVIAQPLCAQTNASRDGVTVTIDPVVALTNYTSLGEWNTDGNFEGWSTGQITNAVVAGGNLSGGASGTDSQLLKTNFAGGPDLDLGFNDYLEVRLQLPADY